MWPFVVSYSLMQILQEKMDVLFIMHSYVRRLISLSRQAYLTGSEGHGKIKYKRIRIKIFISDCYMFKGVQQTNDNNP